MKKKILLTIVVCMLSLSFLFGEKMATLQEVTRPDMVLAKDGKLYVLEKTSIFIYSLKDFRLIKKFGRSGEGPMEFMARPFGPPLNLYFHSGKLVVNSINKLSFFTLDGKYIDEEKVPPDAIFYRLKGGYLVIGAAIGEDKQPHVCYRIFSGDFLPQKMLYETEIALGARPDLHVPMNAMNYPLLYKDKIFIAAGKKGFVIDCFNHSGKKLYTIEKKDYKKIKMTDAFRKSIIDWFKSHYQFRNVYETDKHRIKIKEYFPAIRSLTVDNDLLYVITYKTQKELTECIVMDLKGKELKRVFVPLLESEPYTYYPLLYAVENGTYYALLENEDDDTIELHSQKIK